MKTESNITIFRILWSAIFISVLILGSLAYFHMNEPIEPKPSALTLPFAVVAIMDALVSLGLGKYLLSENYLKRFKGSAPQSALARTLPLYLISLAINESVAILGFVLAKTQGASLNEWSPFILGAILLNVIAFFTPQQLAVKLSSPEMRMRN